MAEISGWPPPAPPVRAVTVTSEVMSVPELVMNAFSPSITHSSPSSRAVVRVPPASLPASGSVRPKPASARPAHRSGSHSWRWTSVPKRKMGAAPRPTPASSVMPRDWSTRPSSSMAMHSVVRSAPPPPYSSGKGMPNRPRSPIWRTTSVGKTCSASQRSAWGAISPSAKSRTSLRSASCSSVNSTCTSESYGPWAAPILPPVNPLAVVGGRLLTGLQDVTSDLAALEGSGLWAVVLPFEGSPVLARFAESRPARPWPGAPWRGLAPDAWSTSLDRDGFCAGVRAIRDAIAAGDVYQVNLTRRLSAPLPRDADIAALGAALGQGNPAPYSAVVRLPSVGCHVASASPERFLRRDGDRVASSPIKGTAPDAASFLPKDRAENVMIVDLVRNDLGRGCEWGAVEHHPGLVHLVSTVTGRLRPGVTWGDIVDATFPPGSVTGAPKLAALDHIARLETAPRGVYCGAVGWVDADRGRGELNVAIRTFWVEDGRLHLGTGGGITWDSTPEGEWAETELKAHRLLAVAAGQLTGAGAHR